MSLFPKPRKYRKPKHTVRVGVLPETKIFGGLRYVKHATTTSSKVEAKHKVEELKKQGRMARKVKTKEGYAIYSRSMNV